MCYNFHVMFSDYLKLSFILELQKKYNDEFSLFTKEIFVLPPIFKRGKLRYFLCFPVVKMLSKFNVNLPLEISKPIGAICINNQGDVKVINSLQLDNSTPNNVNSSEKYAYHIEKQETIKSSLDTLSIALRTTSLKLKKEQFDKYTNALKNLLDDEYWEYYEKLKNFDFINKNSNQAANTIDTEDTNRRLIEYKKKIKRDFSSFVKTDIFPYVHNNTSFYKIKLFDELGAFIRSVKFTNNYEKDLAYMQYETVKIIAKILNRLNKASLQIDFLSKILLMIINALLVEQKHKKVINKFEQDLYNYFSIFIEESQDITEEEKEDYFFLQNIYNDLLEDYNRKKGEKYSNIFFAYLYIFN